MTDDPRQDARLAELNRRALAALVRRPVAAATSTHPVPGGVMVLTGDYPSSYEHNKALIVEAAEPRDVLPAVEGRAAAAGLGHVRIDVLETGMAAGMVDVARDSGYEVGLELVMVLPDEAVRDLGAQPPHPAVREVAWEEVRDAVRAAWVAELPDAGPAVHDQLADRRHATARGAQIVHVAAMEAGMPSSTADVYLTGDEGGLVAQVENVRTEPAARGRGLGRAVVTAAVAAAQGRGATAVFLVADHDDWPREFYTRMGFVATTVSTVLTQAPRRG